MRDRMDTDGQGRIKEAQEAKKFIFKISFFLAPLLLLSINFMSYERSGGDLNRLGKISVKKDYRKIFENDFNRKKAYRDMSETEPGAAGRINVLTIGDSFSQQGRSGYQNFLAGMDGLNIVNIERPTYVSIVENPVQFLFLLANGDFLNIKKVDYIVLQVAEKNFVLRSRDLDENKAVMTKTLTEVFGGKGPAKEDEKVSQGLEIFEDMTKYFIYGVLYNFNDRAFIGQAYKKRMTRNLFSLKEPWLLFYFDEVKNIRYSTPAAVRVLNDELNDLSKKLASKGVRLIVLPSPDKYDEYYTYIEDNELPKNSFFDHMKRLKKEYIYIDSRDVLLGHINRGEKDIYFADDTHWSPFAAEIIAGEINKKIHITR